MLLLTPQSGRDSLWSPSSSVMRGSNLGQWLEGPPSVRARARDKVNKGLLGEQLWRKKKHLCPQTIWGGIS